jgi:putative hydrolase of the HAD superfamily
MQDNKHYSEIKVIGFDADDTLWKNEGIFLNAQREYKTILKNFSKNLDEELLKIEKLNLGKYGYGIKGFILSMIETSIRTSNRKLDI